MPKTTRPKGKELAIGSRFGNIFQATPLSNDARLQFEDVIREYGDIIRRPGDPVTFFGITFGTAGYYTIRVKPNFDTRQVIAYLDAQFNGGTQP